MYRMSVKFPALTVLALLFSGAAAAQVGSFRGEVLDADGKGVQDAVIRIERTDVRGNYKVKTDKKGGYFHAGLPLGNYVITLEIDGQVVDKAIGVRPAMGGAKVIDFDLREIAERQKEVEAQGGVPTKDQLATMTKEERKAYEEGLKKREQQISKNKDLNAAFNAGMEAKRLKDYDVAVQQLAKATEIDPEQEVVWANLADAQSSAAQTKSGEARKQMNDAAIASYGKAIELKPETAAYYNNLGLAYVKAGRLEEGKAELQKAAELDPINGGKYYFNLGAVMVNSGNKDGAIDAFRKATEVQPNYADAYYQLGIAMVGAAQIGEDGSIKPVEGTVEAFEKYIELKPGGAMAASAQAMIQSLTGSVDTKFTDPNRKKKRRKKS